MTTAQVVETSVTVTNSSFQNYTHPDDHTTRTVLSIAQNLKREDFFEFRTISKAEIEEALKNLNPNKATGCDLIPPKTLKLAASVLAPSPTELFNEVIAQGSISYPIMWKKGDWVTVHKKDDKMDKVNYRPGTVLNAVNKVFEQQLSKQITEIWPSAEYLHVCLPEVI